MKKLLIMLTVSASILLNVGVSNAKTESGKTKVVFLAGSRSHSNGEHEFYAGSMLLADALNKSDLNIEATVVKNGWPKDESVFDGADACIVYADAGGRFGKKYASLDKLVAEGMGIMFMHYGVHPSKAVGEKYFKKWIAGYMETGFSVNPHWIADVAANKEHPVSNGMPDEFTAYDEFYYNMRFPTKEECDCCGPAATAIPTEKNVIKYINLWNKYGEDGLGKKQTLMWYKDTPTAEGGRGMGFTGGHYHRNWAVDGFRKLVLNAIVWTARVEVPKDGVKSTTVTKAMLNANLDAPNPNKPLELPTDAIYKQKPMKLPELKQAKAAQVKKVSKVAVKVESNDKPRNLAVTRAIKATDKDRTAKIKAGVEGLNIISLQVDALGANNSDWANWTQMQFADAKGKVTAVDESFIKSSSQTWGDLGVNKNTGGGQLMMNGAKVAKGFGTHAASNIQISVPKGAVSFSAVVGIDDGGALRDGKTTESNLRFLIVNDGGSWAPSEAAKNIALEYFQLPKDSNLEITRWAESPMLFNPTNMDIDHKGRVWVAEGVNYRRKGGRRPEGDRIMVLQDTTGDGKADKSHVFVQEKELACPLGVAVFGNKVIVPAPPHLIVYTDVNRDLKFDPAVDKKEILLTGFNAKQHDHSLHSVTAGPDGKWYFNNGNCGAIFKDRSGKTFNMNGVYRGGGGTFFTDNNKLKGKASDDGYVWTSGFGVRINPDGTEAEIFGHGYRNSYEQSVNSLGEVFQNDNDDTGSCRNSYVLEYGCAGFFSRDGQRQWQTERRPGQDIPTAHWRQDDPGTFDSGDVYGAGSPTGNVFYENGALGKEWEGTYIASEAARNTLFGYKPKPVGAAYQMDRFNFLTSNPSEQFVGGDFYKKLGKLDDAANDGVLFRPSDVCVGPDGAIYVADWYDGRVGGHATIDTSCSGAIYRIAPKGFISKVPAMDLETIKGQITALSSPAVNVRHLGFTRLRDNKEKSLDAVVALLDHPNKYVAARAIWLLPYLGEKGVAKAVALLDDENAERRMVALRALRRAKVNILPYAKKLASDPSPAVRRDVALSLRHYTAAETADVFVELAKGYDGNDKNYVESIGLGATNKEDAIWQAIKASQPDSAPEAWTDTFAKITWRLWPVAAVDDLKVRALSPKLTGAQKEFAVESIAFINDKKAAEAMLEIAASKSVAKAKASYWLLKRGTGEWSNFGIKDELKKRGIYDPSKIVVTQITVAEAPKETKLPALEKILAMKGDAERGKAAIMRCAMCHNINGVGPDYGPSLKGWGTLQAKEAIVKSILQPSFDIAHGYKGTEVITKDGKVVHGLAVPGDPLIITSTGGVTQMIPRSIIKSKKFMKRSLMLAPEQLGLSAQDIADITAYMQQWK